MKFLFLIGAFIFSSKLWANTPVYVKVGEAQLKKNQILVLDAEYLGAVAKNPNFKANASEFRQVVMRNLTVTGEFEVYRDQVLLKVRNLDQPPDWMIYKDLKLDYVIDTAFQEVEGQLIFKYRLLNVRSSVELLKSEVRGSTSEIRRLAHKISDVVVTKVTGRGSFFLTKIAVSAQNPQNPGEREIYLMDWDGENKKAITKHRTLALSPAWSLDGRSIAYTAFMQRKSSKERNPDLYIMDLSSGKSRMISYRKGMNSGAFFDSANTLLMTISGEQNPDIFRIDFSGNVVKRLTDGPLGAMNVEPAVSPDGQNIAFSSDRPGRPMLYLMDAQGLNPKRLTFAGTFNAAPSWSPDSRVLAFAGWVEKAFDIFTIEVDSRKIQRITKASKKNGKQASHENPAFSPDGRIILYTSNRTGHNQLYISLADGSEEWRLTEDSWNYYQPKWSPIRE